MNLSDINTAHAMTEGGEGIIYDIPGGVAKIYKKGVNLSEKEKKLNRLMQKKLPTNVISPIDQVKDKNGNITGYTMKKINGTELKMLSNKKFIKTHNIKSKQILNMMAEIKETLKKIHQQNVIIGDLNDQNILFDAAYHVYFIDVDSWCVDELKGTVCMESFQDPNLQKNTFTKETDAYAFAILLFKCLTLIHPFGGISKPEMNLLDRMKQKISVLDRSDVTVPKLAKKWNFLSPQFLASLKDIFEKGKRDLIDTELEDMIQHFSYCETHEDGYYSRYNTCPVCNEQAKIRTKPIQRIHQQKAIPSLILFQHSDVRVVLSPWSYINHKGETVRIKDGMREKAKQREKIVYLKDASIYCKVRDDELEIVTKHENYVFEKQYQSKVQFKGEKIYYVTKNLWLTEINYTEKGNQITPMQKVGIRHQYHVESAKKYFIYSQYDKKIILNIEGYTKEIPWEGKIQDIGIHYDVIKNQWLWILLDTKGVYHTRVFEKNHLSFHEKNLKYSVNLRNLCFSNGNIFMAKEKVIRGYNCEKNQYKDFNCPEVEEGAKVIKKGHKFLLLNEQKIIQFG